MNISITINDTAIQAKLAELKAKTGKLKDCMERIGQEYERAVLSNFNAEADPSGVKWKPLSAVTMMLAIAAKKGFKTGKETKGYLNAFGRRRIETKKILIGKGNNGGLSGSIHHTSSKDSVIIGVSGSIKYAAIHQFGGQAGRNRKVTIPARPYLAMKKGTNGLELSERDRKMVMGIIEEYMNPAFPDYCNEVGDVISMAS